MEKTEKTKTETEKQPDVELKLKEYEGKNKSGSFGSIGGSGDFLHKVESYMVQNEKLLIKVYKTSEKVRKYLFWINVMNVLKTLLIILPIVLSIIYLPYFLKSLFPNIGNTPGGEGQSFMKIIKPNEVLNQYQQLLGQ